MGSGGVSTLNFIVFMFLLALAILWFLLPFAIFGTKDLLEKLIVEQIKTREVIEKLFKEKEASPNADKDY